MDLPAPEGPIDLGELHRREYGRMLATLIRVVRDITLAEDSLQEAFAAALDKWPAEGKPPNPVASLRTTARQKARDQTRRGVRAKNKREQMISGLTPEENAP